MRQILDSVLQLLKFAHLGFSLAPKSTANSPGISNINARTILDDPRARQRKRVGLMRDPASERRATRRTVVYDRSMATMTQEQVRSWIAGFEAIKQADRERLSRTGPRPKWSVAVSLSLIEAARASAKPLHDPRREAEDERVRQVWARLKAPYLP
jgi:hypothetical protein